MRMMDSTVHKLTFKVMLFYNRVWGDYYCIYFLMKIKVKVAS